MIYGSASVTTTVKANQNFLALMALGQNNDKKPTTMERMALLSLLTQKQSKTDMAIFTMLPAGFGQCRRTSQFCSEDCPGDSGTPGPPSARKITPQACFYAGISYFCMTDSRSRCFSLRT